MCLLLQTALHLLVLMALTSGGPVVPVFWPVVLEGFWKILLLFSGKTGQLTQQGGGQEPGGCTSASLTLLWEKYGTHYPNSL